MTIYNEGLEHSRNTHSKNFTGEGTELVFSNVVKRIEKLFIWNLVEDKEGNQTLEKNYPPLKTVKK